MHAIYRHIKNQQKQIHFRTSEWTFRYMTKQKMFQSTDQKISLFFKKASPSIKDMRMFIHIIYRTAMKRHFCNFTFQKESKYLNNFQLSHLKGLKGSLWHNGLIEKSETTIPIPNFVTMKNEYNLKDYE